MLPALFFLIAFLSEIVGTIAGFGSSVFFVPLAGFLFGFHEVLALTSILHVFSNTATIGFDACGTENSAGPTKCRTRKPRRKSRITRKSVMNSSKRERGPSRKISSARSGEAVSVEPDGSSVSTIGVFGSTRRRVNYAVLSIV